VVFLDIEFPNDDGFHILPELQADPRLQQVPIVAYSVHTNELPAAREVGFHSFLGKPLDVSAFPGQLRRILNGQSVWEVGQ
jgi:two-component system cell cycle response regulator DivK